MRAVGPWPEGGIDAARLSGCAAPGVGNAFPSGRAALLACLEELSLGPDEVVGIPDCVTDCVANAVKRVARPMALRVALESAPARLGAAIVYEQWGWPVSADGQDTISQTLRGVPIIVDRVDSSDFFKTQRHYGAYEVLSLSKTLGLPAGGMARHLPDGIFHTFEPRGEHMQRTFRTFEPRGEHMRSGLLLTHPAVRERYKQSQTVHPAVLAWLTQNCPVRAAEAERAARNQTARAILGSNLSAAWPAWMATAIQAGAGPVWAPILRSCPPDLHWQAIARLAHALGIEAAVRPFNWSGNPLAPRFEPCVALPIHSGVAPEVVSVLSGSRT